MEIAIIGAGNVGGGLGRALTAAGHRVTFAAEDPASAEETATVADLATSIGYRPIDCGPLEMARSLERMAFLNISLNATNGWSWQSAWRLVGPLS